MKSYSLPILLSIIGHGLLVFLVVWGWSVAAEKPTIKKPAYIKATLIQVEQKARPVEQKKQPPKPDEALKKQQEAAAKKRREQEKKQQEAKRLAEKKKAEQKKAEQKKAAEDKARKNQLAKKREEEKKKQEAERKKREQAEKEKQQKEDEARRKAALEKEIAQERQRELQKRIAAEKAQIEAEQQAANDAELAASYTGIINEKVSANWSRPPSARNGMSVLLRIQLVPTGKVIAVEVTESSGDAAFDRAAVQAVNKAESFPELRELPTRVFEQNFRVFNLVFQPEDLRQ
ncbi:TonB family protein [Eionea flava]